MPMNLGQLMLEMLSPFFDKSLYTQRTSAEREVAFLPTYIECIARALAITKLSDGEARALETWLPNYLKSLDDPTFRWGHKRRIRLLKEIARPYPGKKILDVGCSVGTNLLELSECGCDCYGVDLTLPFVKVLKTRAKCLNLQVHVLIADAGHLPFNRDAFETVMTRETLSHVANIDDAICEMHRVANNKIIVEDTNMMSIGLLILLLSRDLGLRWLLTKNRIHPEYHKKQRNENIHSSFWWRKRLASWVGYTTLVSALPFDKSIVGKLLRFMYRFFGAETVLISEKNASARSQSST